MLRISELDELRHLLKTWAAELESGGRYEMPVREAIRLIGVEVGDAEDGSLEEA